jgi:hypothetical protein
VPPFAVAQNETAAEFKFGAEARGQLGVRSVSSGPRLSAIVIEVCDRKVPAGTPFEDQDEPVLLEDS